MTLIDLVYKTMKKSPATINDDNILVFEIWKLQSYSRGHIGKDFVNLEDAYKGARVESILRARRKLLETKTDFKR
jgi:hypothetical protein